MSRLNLGSSMNSNLGYEASDLGSPKKISPALSNRVTTMRNQIHPENFVDEEEINSSKSRKILAQNIENGEGDLNTVWDKERIQRRKRWHMIFTIVFLVLLGLALACSLAGLGVSIYYYVEQYSNSNQMSLYGIVASSFFIVYSIFSIIIVCIDGFYIQGKKLSMVDYRFFLDVDVKQFSMFNENILLYSPELVTNQIIPKYEQAAPQPPQRQMHHPQVQSQVQPQMQPLLQSQPVSPTQLSLNGTIQNQLITTPIQIQRMRPRGKYVYVP